MLDLPTDRDGDREETIRRQKLKNRPFKSRSVLNNPFLNEANTDSQLYLLSDRPSETGQTSKNVRVQDFKILEKKNTWNKRQDDLQATFGKNKCIRLINPVHKAISNLSKTGFFSDSEGEHTLFKPSNNTTEIAVMTSQPY